MKTMRRLFLLFILAQALFLSLSEYWGFKKNKQLLREVFSDRAEISANSIAAAYGALRCVGKGEEATELLGKLNQSGLFEFAKISLDEKIMATTGVVPARAEVGGAQPIAGSQASLEHDHIFSTFAEIPGCHAGESRAELEVGFSYRNLDAPLQSQFLVQCQVLALGIGSTILALFMLGQLINNYLEKIIKRCKRIAQGLLTEENMFSSNNEFYVVSETLNSMCHSLSKLQADTEAQRARLISTAKMSSLGEMAGGVAHEINNPLAIILAKAAQLHRRIVNGQFEREKFQDDLQKIMSTAERIAKIVRGLRSFSRNADSDPMENINLSKIVDESLELCAERFKFHAIELRVQNRSAADVLVNGRQAQLSQVLVNLLSNAQDATEGLSERWVELAFTRLNNRIRILLTDSGPGIAPEILEKIMQPFFTTKPVGKGTGLGLSISRGIVADHGGSLEYDRSCKNTRFVIDLPIAEPRPSQGDGRAA